MPSNSVYATRWERGYKKRFSAFPNPANAAMGRKATNPESDQIWAGRGKSTRDLLISTPSWNNKKRFSANGRSNSNRYRSIFAQYAPLLFSHSVKDNKHRTGRVEKALNIKLCASLIRTETTVNLVFHLLGSSKML